MDIFAAIADPTRRQLLERLAAGEQPVRALAEPFGVSLSAISQHLRVLREAGLVADDRRGRERYYRIQAEPLQAVGEWISAYEPFWRNRLTRLGDYLERSAE